MILKGKMFTSVIIQRISCGTKRILERMTRKIEQYYLGPDRLMKEGNMSLLVTESKK